MPVGPETSRRGTLDVDDVEAIARRVAELLAQTAVPAYLDTAAVARMIDASEEWVRDHAVELGAIRLGDGRRGVLRFELARVHQALERRRLARPSARRSRRRRAPRAAGVPLLPLPAAVGAPR